MRLKVINPDEFLSDDEVQATLVNTVEKKKFKLSECKKSFFNKKDGEIRCKCPERADPPPCKEKLLSKAFDIISEKVKAMEGDLSETLGTYLKDLFKVSSMNTCQTQALSMMNVPKMMVEFCKTPKTHHPDDPIPTRHERPNQTQSGQ